MILGLTQIQECRYLSDLGKTLGDAEKDDLPSLSLDRTDDRIEKGLRELKYYGIVNDDLKLTRTGRAVYLKLKGRF